MGHQQARVGDHLFEVKTFTPTLEEFQDLSKYISTLEGQGVHKSGICKIVAPKEWIPRRQGYRLEDIEFEIERPLQQTLTPEPGDGGVFRFSSKLLPPITVTNYAKMTQMKQYLPPAHQSYEELEEKYWDTTKAAKFLDPIYGADVNESLTDSDCEIWNVSKLDSILNEGVQGDNIIPGVNNSYLYFGMWAATFSWHVEDMDLYATNYLHYGAPKTWYCIPPEHGYKMELLAKVLFPDWHKICNNFIRHKICMINPEILRRHGIPVLKAVQEEREFIVVFPHAYHSGFNHGFNIAEAANFALPRWVEYGKRYRACCCAQNISAVDGQRLSLHPFISKYQPDRYDKWKAGKDYGPHPEDPEVIKSLYNNLDLANLEDEDKKVLKRLAITLDHPTLETPQPLENYQAEQHKEVEMDFGPSYDEDDFSLKRCDVGLEQIQLDEDVLEELRQKHSHQFPSRSQDNPGGVSDGQRGRGRGRPGRGRGSRGGKVASFGHVYHKDGQYKGFLGVSDEELKARKSLRKCRVRHRLMPCKKCDGCQQKDCGECDFCLDKPKFGGPGTMKQKCIHRNCTNPSPSVCDQCSWNVS